MKGVCCIWAEVAAGEELRTGLLYEGTVSLRPEAGDGDLLAKQLQEEAASGESLEHVGLPPAFFPPLLGSVLLGTTLSPDAAHLHESLRPAHLIE